MLPVCMGLESSILEHTETISKYIQDIQTSDSQSHDHGYLGACFAVVSDTMVAPKVPRQLTHIYEYTYTYIYIYIYINI